MKPFLQRSVEELQELRSQQSEYQKWMGELIQGIWGNEEKQRWIQEEVGMMK